MTDDEVVGEDGEGDADVSTAPEVEVDEVAQLWAETVIGELGLTPETLTWDQVSLWVRTRARSGSYGTVMSAQRTRELKMNVYGIVKTMLGITGQVHRATTPARKSARQLDLEVNMKILEESVLDDRGNIVGRRREVGAREVAEDALGREGLRELVGFDASGVEVWEWVPGT